MRIRLRADLYRAYGRSGFLLGLRAWLLSPTTRVAMSHRVVNWALGLPPGLASPVTFVAKTFHWRAQRAAGIDLPWRTQIGPALKITHGWGLVVSAGARIGSNVTLMHGVTIGQKDRITEAGRTTAYPVIEDEVWIGAHAVIIGGVRVGCGAIIGPGTVVTKDVPARCVVVGNPMRVVREHCIADVVNRVEALDSQLSVDTKG